MTPRVEEVMDRQLEAFRKKFGRDRGPGDPVFFDPDEDEPTPMRNLQAQVLAAMEKANLPPEIAYAYAKTGRLLMEGQEQNYPPEAIAEWNAAIDEYHAIEAAKTAARPKSPKAKSAAMPESDEERAKVMGLTLEEFRVRQHVHNYPGFKGELEFDIEFDLLGFRVKRRARAQYEHTPEWEYFDLKKQALFTGFASSTYGLSLLTVPDERDLDVEVIETYDDQDDPRPPAWVRLDLVRTGMLPEVVWDKVFYLIDEKCKAEDQERRRRYCK